MVAAILDHVVSENLTSQEKAGHDIGWLGRLIASTPQFWVVAVAFMILVLWCFEPWLRDKRRSNSGTQATEGAVYAHLRNADEILQHTKDELNATTRANAALHDELANARGELAALQQQLVALRNTANHDRLADLDGIRLLKGSAGTCANGLREKALILVSEMLQFSVTALNNTPSHREQPFEVFLNDRRRYWKYQNDRFAEEYGARLVAIHDDFAKVNVRDTKWDMMPREYWTQTENAGFIAERVHALAMQVK